MEQEAFEYDTNGRLLYHPALHKRQGALWTDDELEYLCKFHDIDGLMTISLALERAQTTCASKLTQVRKNGKYWHYRNLNKYYITLRS